MIELIQTAHVPALGVPAKCVRLVPVRQTRGIKDISLWPGTHLLGSDSACDVTLPIDGVEPQHCSIHIDGDEAVLNARSPMTWVNDGPVREQPISPDDLLTIGPVEFRVHFEEPAVPAPVVSVAYATNPPIGLEDVLDAIQPPTVSTVLQQPADDGRLPESRSQVQTHSPQTSQPHELESVTAELERQRAHVQSLIGEPPSEQAQVLQSRTEQKTATQHQHDDLARLKCVVLEGQQLVMEEQRKLELHRADLERRVDALKEAESQARSKEAQLQQVDEQLAVARQDQYERERLLQQRIEELNNAEAVLVEREGAIRQESEALERRTRELAGQVEANDQQKNDLEQQSRDQKQAADDWNTERAALEEQLDGLRNENCALGEELSALRDELVAEEAVAEEREAKIATREAAVEELSAELARERESIQQQLAGIAAQRAALDEERESLEERWSDLQAGADAVESEQEALEGDRAAFESRRSVLDQTAAELECLQEQLSRERDDVEEARQELAQEQIKLSEEQRQLSDDRAVLKNEIQDAQARENASADARDELKAWESELASRLTDIKRFHADLFRQRAANLERRDEVAQEQSLLTELQTQLEDRERELSEEGAQLQERSRQLAESEALLNERAAPLTEQSAIIEKESSDLAEQQQVLFDRERQIAQREAAVADAEAELADGKESLRDLERARREVAQSREELDRHREEIGSLRMSLEQERRTLREDQESCDVLQRNLLARKAELEADNVQRQEQLDKLKSDLFKTIEDRNSARADLDVRTEQLESLEDGSVKLREEVDRLKSDLASAEESLNTFNEERQHRSKSADLSELTGEPVISAAEEEELDAFEVSDADTAEDVEVVDDATATGSIATQMAALFGFGQITPSADEPATNVTDEIPSVASLAESLTAEHHIQLDADDPDSINTYMEQLLERHQGIRAAARPQPEPSSESTGIGSTPGSNLLAAFLKDDPANTDRDAGQSTRTKSEPASPDPTDELDVPEDTRARRTAEELLELERQHRSSFRELAILSSRSALAKHHSVGLRKSLIVQMIVATIGVIASIAMFVSPLLGGGSFISHGAVIAVMSLLMMWRASMTSIRMQQNAAIRSGNYPPDEASGEDTIPGELETPDAEGDDPSSDRAESIHHGNPEDGAKPE